MRRMLIASGPSASATAMAALTISSRDSPRSRRGGCAPRCPVPLDVPGDPLLAGFLPRRLAGAQVLAPVPEVRRLLVVLVRTVCLAGLGNPAHLPVRLHHAPLLLAHCHSFRRPACPNQRASHVPATAR